MVTLDQLVVLSALEETGSFSAAAERLHRAQSAVSYAVKTLESELGITLFDRSGYRAKLTLEGVALLGKAREVLAKTGELEGLAAAFTGGWEAELMLLMDGVLPVSGVMRLLAGLQEEDYPTSVRLRIEILGRFRQALQTECPDLMLASPDMVVLPHGYEETSLGEMVMLPVTAPGHPLANAVSPVPLEQVRQHVHLIVSDPLPGEAPVNSSMVGAKRQWLFPDFLSRLEGLRAGLGFAWMPSYMVQGDLETGSLVALRIDGRNLYRFRIALMARQTPPLGRMGTLLRERLLALPELLPPAPRSLLAQYEGDAGIPRT